MSLSPPVVRDASTEDIETIVDFNERLASETEGKTLDRAVLARGVRSALADPDRLRYWVAVDNDGRILGQAAVTREWSDWRSGWIWWFQSVYVRQDARQRGVFRSLYAHVREAALRADDVIGLRLYVENENTAAQRSYASVGMMPGGYHVYEEIWRDRFGGKDD